MKEGEDRCPISGKQGAESGTKNVGLPFQKDKVDSCFITINICI